MSPQFKSVIFQVLADYKRKKRRRCTNKPLFLTLLVPEHAFSEVTRIPLAGTLFACYNIQQRIMAAK